MSDWLKTNAISIVIAVVTLVSTYAIYGYRLSAVESRQTSDEVAITALQVGNTNTLVSLARIETDIEYIKGQLSQLVTNTKK